MGLSNRAKGQKNDTSSDNDFHAGSSAFVAVATLRINWQRSSMLGWSKRSKDPLLAEINASKYAAIIGTGPAVIAIRTTALELPYVSGATSRGRRTPSEPNETAEV